MRYDPSAGCSRLPDILCRERKVFYRKSFGFHTYDSVRNVRNEDLYDLASVTKISATLPLVMQLASRKVINLKGSLGTIFRGKGNEQGKTDS
jgi:CubicO group peptidase (beta-lactamase class C family)